MCSFAEFYKDPHQLEAVPCASLHSQSARFDFYPLMSALRHTPEAGTPAMTTQPVCRDPPTTSTTTTTPDAAEAALAATAAAQLAAAEAAVTNSMALAANLKIQLAKLKTAFRNKCWDASAVGCAEAARDVANTEARNTALQT